MLCLVESIIVLMGTMALVLRGGEVLGISKRPRIVMMVIIESAFDCKKVVIDIRTSRERSVHY
jgi:hypothetical protein